MRLKAAKNPVTLPSSGKRRKFEPWRAQTFWLASAAPQQGAKRLGGRQDRLLLVAALSPKRWARLPWDFGSTQAFCSPSRPSRPLPLQLLFFPPDLGLGDFKPPQMDESSRREGSCWDTHQLPTPNASGQVSAFLWI